MAENKTQKTTASVSAFLATVKDVERRKDCQTVSKLMKKATGKPAKMWGTAIVGFGDLRIKGASREIDWFVVGFSPRKSALTLYLGSTLEKLAPQLERLGKHKVGRGCLYVNSLEDVDVKVLEKVITTAVKTKQS